jgi:hypothetical protein
MLVNLQNWSPKMAENRKPREIETRQQSVRPEAWKPPELLPEPDKQAGFAYRWIRVSTLNSADPRNLSAKLREGWEPVRAEEQPKFQLLIDPNSRFKDNIEIGGLLLCKTPDEFVDQRNKHYQKQAENQMDAVDSSLLRQSDPRMPLFSERKSTTTFGKGS